MANVQRRTWAVLMQSLDLLQNLAVPGLTCPGLSSKRSRFPSLALSRKKRKQWHGCDLLRCKSSRGADLGKLLEKELGLEVLSLSSVRPSSALSSNLWNLSLSPLPLSPLSLVLSSKREVPRAELHKYFTTQPD